jgi:hypothetical protein
MLRIAVRSLLAIALFGAATSRANAESAAPYDWAKWREFWAFQPVGQLTVPSVANSNRVRNPIDAFVLARVDEKHLVPAPQADKLTLIRRVTFDLTGLPPTPEEIRAFLADKSADAYEKLVDRLLASPHYGEHWGRHWLDVARYVPGRISFPGVKGSRGDQAYRDYVVRAFNNDKPFNRFVTEQLAGDLLPATQDRQQYFDQITAPAFLSIGSWFDMETDPNRLRLEMVDEQINTVSKAFLGLSVACARCHDHKFDPIPTEDYYALAGVFRSTRLVGDFSEFWRDGRVRQLRPLAMPDEVTANDAIRARIDVKKAELWQCLTDQHAKLTAKWRADESKYRGAAKTIPPTFSMTIEAERFDGQDNLRIAQLMRDGRSVDVLETQTPGPQWVKYKVTVPETGTYRLNALYSTDEGAPLYLQANGKYATETALTESTGGWDLKFQRWDTVGTFELRKGLNFLRLGIKAGTFPRLDRIRIIRQNEATEVAITQAASAGGLNAKLLENFVFDPASPYPTISGIVPFLDDAARPKKQNLQNEATELAKQIKPYEPIVAVTDFAEPVDLPVHARGETYTTAGTPVPRGTLRLLDSALPRPTVSQGSSGRLELAGWITDSRNPLTARVIVNRVWQWHFGRGIVATPSDFGSRGEPPTHPELLDWLASRFVQEGWSIKKLNRLIVTTAVYRMQSGAPDLDDPDNKWLAHFPRKRLEAEAMYDAMRSTTNMIPRQVPGAPPDVDKSAQRAMYVLTNGRVPPGMGGEVRKFFTLFDYDLGVATSIAQRPTSQTPAQSLFWMNSPLVNYMAERFADRLLKMDKLDDSKRIDMAYVLALGHEPSDETRRRAIAFIEQAQSADGATRAGAWTKFCQALYATAEFRFLE